MENENTIKNNLDKLNQFRLNPDLVNEFETFLSNTNLSDNDVNKLGSIIERMITQHYVKQLLAQSL